jgi:hypothetical protein
MNLIKEMQNAAEQITAEHAKELQLTEKSIKHIMSIHCKNLQPDNRPPEFPEHLWKYVFNTLKKIRHHNGLINFALLTLYKC